MTHLSWHLDVSTPLPLLCDLGQVTSPLRASVNCGDGVIAPVLNVCLKRDRNDKYKAQDTLLFFFIIHYFLKCGELSQDIR